MNLTEFEQILDAKPPAPVHGYDQVPSNELK